jgi:hypothetical protein
MSLSPTSSRGSSVGGAGALTLLSTTTLAVDGVYDVTGISQSYNDLIISMLVRGARLAAQFDALQMRFNNDSGANYNPQRIYAQGATVTATGGGGSNAFTPANIPAATAPANQFAQVDITIGGYTNTAFQRTFTAVTAGERDVSFTSEIVTGLWLSTAAVNRIGFFGSSTANLLAGTVLRIYGRL